MKSKVYFTSPVFFEITSHEKVSQELKDNILKLKNELEKDAEIIISEKRFPSEEEIRNVVETEKIDFIGCHLSHPISEDVLNNTSIKGVCTSTAGYNHIKMVPNIIYCHTPGVLDKTVADFTIAVILANLRNIVSLNNFVWSGNWDPNQKWDLDENLNNVMDNKVLGLVGLGEIGLEVARRLLPWGVSIKYFDLKRNETLENEYSNLSYEQNVDDIFSTCDIVSLHIPLNNHTMKYVDERKLKLMKKGALLVNTARGPIVDFDALTRLLKSHEIQIDLSFDVYDPEPISPKILNDFKIIMKEQPNRRFIFMPHNASSDADTRAKMSIMILEDLISLVNSHTMGDLKSIRFIPPQRKFASASNDLISEIEQYRISQWWKNKK